MKQIKKSDRPISTPELFVARLDGGKTRTLDKFYKKIAKKLYFPDYFGHNLDALADCLCDLSWIGQPSVKLFIKNPEEFLSEESEEMRQSVMEIFEDARDNPIDEESSFEVMGAV